MKLLGRWCVSICAVEPILLAKRTRRTFVTLLFALSTLLAGLEVISSLSILRSSLAEAHLCGTHLLPLRSVDVSGGRASIAWRAAVHGLAGRIGIFAAHSWGHMRRVRLIVRSGLRQAMRDAIGRRISMMSAMIHMGRWRSRRTVRM